MNRLEFVADHQDTFEVKRLCKGVEVGRSSYYVWLAGAQARAQRRADDDALAERIRQVHEADRAYGAPRVTAELNDPYLTVNASTVSDARLVVVPASGDDPVPEQERALERVNHKRVVQGDA